MRRAGIVALLVVALVHPAIASAPPQVTSVEPTRQDALLTCTVGTANLPGDRIASSLESGLPSAVELDLDVFDARDRVVGGRRIFLRLAFDLWEEVFQVEGAGEEHRFADLDSLERFLARVPRLPVSPLATLHGSERHRIRVGLRLHPIAPEETDRLAEWVAGEPEDAGGDEVEDPDGREVSVSLGEVIRFFYRGARRPGQAEAERLSAWFVPDELASDEEEHAATPN